MEIKGKIIAYGVLIALILLLLLVSLGIVNINFGKSTENTLSVNNDNIPEKCRLPSGQDIDAWKEHLSHHTETRECLQYFN